MYTCPRVIAALPALIPSTIIGVVKPLSGLHRAGKIKLDITFDWLVKLNDVVDSDLIVLCRNIEPEHSRILDWSLELGKPIIYELDDNLLETPDTTAGLRYFHDPPRQAQLKKYIQKADLVRVYSKTLLNYLYDCNQNTVLVNGPLDWSLVPNHLPRNNSKRIRIVYATSRLEDEVGAMIIRVVQMVLTAYPQAEFTVWGPKIKDIHRMPRICHIKPILDYDRFFHKFARKGFDIGLAPLPDDLFHRCKSNNKFREYGACGVAGVYSDMEVYNSCVQQGITGLLVGPNKSDWFNAIARLIEEASFRESIRYHAQNFTRQHYNQERMESDWLSQINEVLVMRHNPCRQYPRRISNLIQDKPATQDSKRRFRIGALLWKISLYGFKLISVIRKIGSHAVIDRIRFLLRYHMQRTNLKFDLWRLKKRYLKTSSTIFPICRKNS